MSRVKICILDDHILYLNQLVSFFNNTSFHKCQTSLAVIQQLLSFKLSKSIMLQLVNQKTNASKVKSKELASSITDHFERYRVFTNRRIFHERASHKLAVLVHSVIFIIRFKTANKRKDHRRQALRTHQSAFIIQEHFLDSKSLNSASSVPVKFTMLNPEYLRTISKGCKLKNM